MGKELHIAPVFPKAGARIQQPLATGSSEGAAANPPGTPTDRREENRGGVQITAEASIPLDPAFAANRVGQDGSSPHTVGPRVGRPYLVEGEDLWGTARFDATEDPTKLRVTMKWTRFEPDAWLAVRIPHRSTELTGEARRTAEGRWTISLPIPVPPAWDRHERHVVNLTADSGGELAFESPFAEHGRLTLAPANWPEQLSKQEISRTFAKPGRIVTSRLEPLSHEGKAELPWMLTIPTLLPLFRERLDYTEHQGVLTVEEGGSKRDIAFEYVEPEGSGPHPLVVVNSILIGNYELEGLLMRYLAEFGYATMLVHRPGRWFEAEDTPRDLAADMRQTVVDQRYLLDHLLATRPIDGARIAATGVCTGGTSSLVLKAADDRIGPVFAIVPPSNMAEVIPATTLYAPRRFVRANLERLGEQNGEPGNMDEAEARLLELLATEIRADPMRLLANLPPLFGPDSPRGEQIKLVIATADKVVPARLQRELWAATGQHGADFYRPGHNGLRYDAVFIAQDMLTFLAEQLRPGGRQLLPGAARRQRRLQLQRQP
jgi:hypothetical protein